MEIALRETIIMWRAGVFAIPPQLKIQVKKGRKILRRNGNCTKAKQEFVDFI